MHQAADEGRLFRQQENIEWVAIVSGRRWHKTELKWKGLANWQGFVEKKQLVFFVVFELRPAAFGRLDDNVHIRGFGPKRTQTRYVSGRFHESIPEETDL